MIWIQLSFQISNCRFSSSFAFLLFSSCQKGAIKGIGKLILSYLVSLQYKQDNVLLKKKEGGVVVGEGRKVIFNLLGRTNHCWRMPVAK